MADIHDPSYPQVTPVDRVTKARTVTDSNHSQIHAGNAFSLVGSMQVATTKVGAIQIDVPAGAYVHFQALSFTTSLGPTSVSLLENYAMDETAAGSASTLTPRNHHRISGRNSSLTVTGYIDVTATAVPDTDQATLTSLYLPGTSTGVSKVGSAAGQSEEWILNAGSSYLLAFSNSNGSTTTFGYNLFWYEEGGA